MNRSVAAAQRRRAGPQNESRPPVQRPTPSIASASNFQHSQQSYPSQGQYQQQIPGHLAGQYADVQQKQYLSGQGQLQQQPQQNVQPRGKMSVPQAITLITLRLGRVESHLQDLEFQNLGNTSVNEDGTPNVSGQSIDVEGIYKEIDFIKEELVPMKSDFSHIYKPGIVSLKNDCAYHSRELISIKSEMREIKYQINTLLQFMKSIQEKEKEPQVVVEDVSENEEQEEHQSSETLENLEASDIKELVKNALQMEITEKPEVDQDNDAPTFSTINAVDQ